MGAGWLFGCKCSVLFEQPLTFFQLLPLVMRPSSFTTCLPSLPVCSTFQKYFLDLTRCRGLFLLVFHCIADPNVRHQCTSGLKSRSGSEDLAFDDIFKSPDSKGSGKPATSPQLYYSTGSSHTISSGSTISTRSFTQNQISH